MKPDDSLLEPTAHLGIEPGSFAAGIEAAESAEWVDAVACLKRLRADTDALERYVVQLMRTDGRLAWHEIAALFGIGQANAHRRWSAFDTDPLPGRPRRPRRGTAFRKPR